MYILKSLSSLNHHFHTSSCSTLSCHPCSLLILRGATMEQVTPKHSSVIMAPAHLQLFVLLYLEQVPLSRASDKLQVPQYKLTTTHQLLLLIFGEGVEFSSHPHTCHPVTLHSSLLLNSQVTMRGRNLAATVDITQMDWELKDSRRRFSAKILKYCKR